MSKKIKTSNTITNLQKCDYCLEQIYLLEYDTYIKKPSACRYMHNACYEKYCYRELSPDYDYSEELEEPVIDGNKRKHN